MQANGLIAVKSRSLPAKDRPSCKRTVSGSNPLTGSTTIPAIMPHLPAVTHLLIALVVVAVSAASPCLVTAADRSLLHVGCTPGAASPRLMSVGSGLFWHASGTHASRMNYRRSCRFRRRLWTTPPVQKIRVHTHQKRTRDARSRCPTTSTSTTPSTVQARMQRPTITATYCQVESRASHLFTGTCVLQAARAVSAGYPRRSSNTCWMLPHVGRVLSSGGVADPAGTP
jgi:hypothetical protein